MAFVARLPLAADGFRATARGRLPWPPDDLVAGGFAPRAFAFAGFGAVLILAALVFCAGDAGAARRELAFAALPLARADFAALGLRAFDLAFPLAGMAMIVALSGCDAKVQLGNRWHCCRGNRGLG
ncbi:MAG TPA: hypothetical protein VGF45_15310 [Polyangia bacterium]